MRWRKLLVSAVMICGVMGTTGAAVGYLWWPGPDALRRGGGQALAVVRGVDSAAEAWQMGKRWLGRISSQVRREPYPLDTRSRIAVRKPGGGLICPDLDLEHYDGKDLAYRGTISVNAHFKERLARFEAIAAEVGEEVYGRPPTRVAHFGAYNCRKIRGSSLRLSEHALGNALDVAGFEFDALEADRRKELGRAGGAFTVSVEEHWDATKGFERKHAVFLKTLARRLHQRGVFRGMLVPPAAGHHDHFHLDMTWFAYFNGDPSL